MSASLIYLLFADDLDFFPIVSQPSATTFIFFAFLYVSGIVQGILMSFRCDHSHQFIFFPLHSDVFISKIHGPFDILLESILLDYSP